MKGLQIFTHSLRQVTNNLEPAIRISGVLYLVQVVVGLIFGRAMMSGGMDMMSGGGMGFGALIVLLVALITGIWIAIAWHRYVLLAENPAALVPPPLPDRMMAYFLRSLLIGLLVIVGGAVLGAIVGMLAMPLMMNGAAIIGLLLMTLLVQVPLMFVGFRLATSLPAMALGVDNTFMSGWEATKDDWRAILELSVIMALVVWVINLIGYFVFSQSMMLMQIWQLLTGWPIMMVGLSVLTTLYGHYMEKRPLA